MWQRDIEGLIAPGTCTVTREKVATSVDLALSFRIAHGRTCSVAGRNRRVQGATAQGWSERDSAP